MTSSYSSFYKSGFHAAAASVYTYTHPNDDDMDHDNASLSATGDLVYFPAASYRAQNAPSSPTRKRRSSITSAMSPVSAMKLAKSPTRAAGNAWHIAHLAAASPGRSRSGSLDIASEDTSMLGRMRSGSVGSRLRSKRPLTNRRPVAMLFAPTPPPPSAPLPALPLCAPARPPLSRLAIQPALPAADVFTKPPASPLPLPSSPSAELYHAFNTIDEEM
ncbi:hypothetical protein DFH06DRAFT_1228706, partial [Mycena polygramma]